VSETLRIEDGGRSRRIAIVTLVGVAVALSLSLQNASADVGGQEGDDTYSCGSLAAFIVRPGATDHRWRVDGGSAAWAGTNPRHFIRPNLACREALFPWAIAVAVTLAITTVSTAAAALLLGEAASQQSYAS